MKLQNYCPWETRSPGGVVFIGSQPSIADVREGRPFVEYSAEGSVLKAAMKERGILRDRISILTVSRYSTNGNEFYRQDEGILKAETVALRAELKRLAPSVVVTLGNEAAFTMCRDWPSKGKGGVKAASGILDLRGFVFESAWVGCPVVVTVHPETVVSSWTPWRVLFSLDLQRAKDISKNGFSRPIRKVEVIT